MSNRSTIQQLLIFLHDIFGFKYQTDTIYLDISKAFDSVSHFHLLDKFTSFGRLWLWCRAYLNNRFQYVSVNNQFSQLLPVKSGVSQGIRTLCFLLFISMISPMLYFIAKLYSFLMILNVFVSSNQSHSDQQLLQQDLNSLLNWSTKSNLSFKPSKSVHVSYNSYFLFN